MNHSFNRTIFAGISVITLLALSLAPVAAQNISLTNSAGRPEPQVIYPVHSDVSLPLQDMKSSSVLAPAATPASIPFHGMNQQKHAAAPVDPAILQSAPGTQNALTQGVSFDGVHSGGGITPPDPMGAVGPNHYVEWVNTQIAVYNKSGTVAAGFPKQGNTIWTGFGGQCETNNSGDPIVLYDQLADRWFISQFALGAGNGGPFHQCIAVSQTPDPTGAWYRYDYLWSATIMNDYPHFGIWPDGYYMTVNQFTGGTTWAGAGVAAFDRVSMLAGAASPAMISYNLFSTNSAFGGMLPANLDGLTKPPTGSPEYFGEWDDSTWIGPVDAFRIWQFHVDWVTPANSTFGLSLQPNQTINTANNNPLVTCGASSGPCVPQKGTTQQLDTVGDRIMHRLVYRNFGSYETLLTNMTGDAGSSRAGIFWFELRKTTGSWGIQQQGLYAPADSNSRWMGSIAMDGSGNIGLGYSLSGSTVNPSVAYSGQQVGDPAGQMTQAEGLLVSGGGSQNGSNRWGDYSSLTIDPTDDCTFWYVNEYYALADNLTTRWSTRIGSFKFNNCIANNSGMLQGVVRDTSNTPLNGATVSNGNISTTSDINGNYSLILPVGSNNITASKPGYSPQSLPVTISHGSIATQDFSLGTLGPATIQGKVTDSGHTNMPLYAKIVVSGSANATVFSDPVTGQYSVVLGLGFPYTFTVSAVGGGYTNLIVPITPTTDPTPQDFALSADLTACTAPGYKKLGSPLTCQPITGGRVVGNIYDNNNPPNAVPITVNGASVTDGVTTAMSFATPDDPNVPDAFYILFTSGSPNLTASMTGGYLPSSQTASVSADTTTRKDFNLPAGYLSSTPTVLSITLPHGQSTTRLLTVTNNSSLANNVSVTYTIYAANGPAPFKNNSALGEEPSPAGSGGFAAVGWLDGSPAGATLTPGSHQDHTLTINTASLLPGTYDAYIAYNNNTPYTIPAVPINLVVTPIHSLKIVNGPTLLGGAVSGTSASYLVNIANNGDYDETYNITTGTHNWNVTVQSTLTVLKGQSAFLPVTVDVPPGTPAGHFDILSLTLTSSSDLTATQTATITTQSLTNLYLPALSR